MKQILINTEGLETRVAVVEDGALEEYFIERRDRDRLAGSIFKGRIKNLEPSLQAAFVDIGTGKNAFLHYWDMLPATKEMLEGEDAEAEPPQSSRGRRSRRDKGRGEPEAKEKGGLFTSLKEKFFPPADRPPPPPGRRRQRRSRKRTPFTVDDIPNLFEVNSEVVVQVTKGPIGHKGARVTTNLSIPGRYLVLMPNSSHVGVSKRVEDRAERERLRQIMRHLKLPPNMGLICRTVGAGRKQKYFDLDLDLLLNCWAQTEQRIKEKRAPCCVYEEPDLGERVLRDFLTEDVSEVVADSKEICDCAQEMVSKLSRQERVKVRYYKSPRPIFAKYHLSDQIGSIFRRQAPLPSGGHICVDETEALIAIDVNSGKNRSGKDHPETIVTTNLEAVTEVARQLRLRNLGGLIVVDFIDMRSRQDQQTVYRAFREALLQDRARTKAYPISQLGLLEMTRQREQESLRDTIFSPCPYCSGKGVIKSSASVSVEIQRRLQEILQRRRKKMQMRVVVHPHVLERLRNEDADLLDSMEKEFGGELSFRADSSLHMEEFRLQDLATGDTF